ncbi:MAG: rhomboid family intramembrane serine protease [Pseudomonadota bacterium]
MPKLYSSSNKKQLNLLILILSASNLPYAVVKSDDGWSLWVKDAHLEKATQKIEAYFRENPEIPPDINAPLPPPLPTTTGIGAAALLLSIHAAVAYYYAREAVFASFGASADRIINGGEVYRAVTALMLHDGPVHLMGNMAGIALFGTAVCAITGAGPGWLMILLSGILGNLANAVFYQTAHLSVGASTAIFGAIGILTAIRLRQKTGGAGWKKRAWLPLAAGLALLAALGTEGEHTDIMAHLFGLLSGLIIGAAHALFIWRPPPKTYQHGCWLVAAGILAWAWLQ